MIIFDDEGVCSGCRLIESRPEINWEEREQWLIDLLAKYKKNARGNNNPYDCIVPVSGGKDSTYQVYLIKEKYKMNPLLVTYNHGFNTKIGIRNLSNLVKQFDCDLLRYTTSPGTAKRLSRYMLEKVGDVTWHYHAGIMTFPIQTAVRYKIPLIVWGEHGFAELLGMFNQDDMVEFTKKCRQEHSMRGFEPEDILNDPENSDITIHDLGPFYYPTDEEIEAVGVRGIYLSNYMYWNGRKQTEFVIKNYGFETSLERDRTFNPYDKLDDIHANGVHDYLKFLKFGYGRATDDASTEIRHGRMKREDGIKLVEKHDHARPFDLDIFLEFIGISEEKFERSIEHLRDPRIWYKDDTGRWKRKDSIGNHVNDQYVEQVRMPLKDDPGAFKKGANRPDAYERDDHIEEPQKEYVIL